MPKKKLDTLINMNAEEYFPVDLSEYTIDYRVLEHFVDNEDKMVHVNMIAAFSPLTEAYAKLAEALGLKLGGIDHSGNSMMNIAKSLKREDTYLLLNLGSNSTMILIVRGEEIRFSRNLPYGTRLIINAK